ncbi:hypothetical protein Tco_0771802 [Tanacetum coccineum]|uniref:Uncharacterized protein n=1 Tax=Tanacetum coccineum TaxID=301880 RepID=A0ABQ4ZHF4_9ASTR
MVPRAVLMKSGLVSVNTARQVNTAHSKTTVNAARPMSYLSNTAHSTVTRPIHKNTTFKNSNINQRVNTVRGKDVNTAKPKAIVNVGNPQMDLQDQGVIDSGCSRHMTWNMSYLTDYEEIEGGYVAFGGNPKGGKITRKATKDKTSGILKSFITRKENLEDHKVKYGVARTPQQNRVTERRNKTLIEAARTMLGSMLAGSKVGSAVTLLHRRIGVLGCSPTTGFGGGRSWGGAGVLVKLERRQKMSKITFCYHYELLIHNILKIQKVLKMIDPNLQVMMERRLMKIQAVIVNVKIKRRKIMSKLDRGFAGRSFYNYFKLTRSLALLVDLPNGEKLGALPLAFGECGGRSGMCCVEGCARWFGLECLGFTSEAEELWAYLLVHDKIVAENFKEIWVYEVKTARHTNGNSKSHYTRIKDGEEVDIPKSIQVVESVKYLTSNLIRQCFNTRIDKQFEKEVVP